MQEVSMQVLTIAMAMNIVSYIDWWRERFRGSSARHQMVSELHSGTQNFKLTKQRSRGTVHAGKDAILWGKFVAQS